MMYMEMEIGNEIKSKMLITVYKLVHNSHILVEFQDLFLRVNVHI